MSNRQGQEQMQTYAEAKSSITGAVQSSFTSLAKMLGIPQLTESFYQNIIYIFMVIVIMIGILVYIQIVSGNGNGNTTLSNNPLFAPPTKEVKKVEIKRIVEGFSLSEEITTATSAADINYDDIDMVAETEIMNDNLYDAYVVEHIEDDKNNNNNKNNKKNNKNNKK